MCQKPSGARQVFLTWAARLLRPVLHPLICQQEFGFCRDVLTGVTDGKLSLHLHEDTLPLMLADRSPVIYLPKHVDDLAAGGCRARDELRIFARAEELPDGLREMLTTASWEALTNAVKYAGGGSLRICASATRIQVWITDRGPGIELAEIPHATLKAGYSTGGTAGLGYTLMVNSAHHLDLLTTPRGTTVVLTWSRELSEDPHITHLLEKYS